METPKFITVLTSTRHLSLSWANSIQSPQPPPISWRSILILSFHLRLGLQIIVNYKILILLYFLRWIHSAMYKLKMVACQHKGNTATRHSKEV